ncbi:hypothetical protein ACWA7J_04690 [Leptothrix sp. BB-4]
MWWNLKFMPILGEWKEAATGRAQTVVEGHLLGSSFASMNFSMHQ